MAFLKETDYDVQIRSEISKILDSTVDKRKMLKAENIAIGQIRNHISERYDCDLIFVRAAMGEEEPPWREYIIMLTIDLALYHLWSKEAANNIPKHRETRYDDAITWLISIQNGKAADLPKLTDTNGNSVSDIRIWSANEPENNRY
jgi:hypothetical protein